MSATNRGTFTTAEAYVILKIKRNNLMVDILELQTIIFQKEIVLNYRTSEINSKKIELIRKINEIEKKQASNFLQENEEQTRIIYNNVNDLHVENFETSKAEILQLHLKCIKMLEQMNQLNNEIPEILEYINIEYELADNPAINILE